MAKEYKKFLPVATGFASLGVQEKSGIPAPIQERPDMSDFAYAVERELISMIDALADAKGFGKYEFAQKVWPWDDRKVAGTRWTTMRNQASNNKKPQTLTIADAVRMGEVLGDDISYMLSIARDKVRPKRSELLK